MGGRPRKPTEQHRKDGTYRACRHRDRVEVPVLATCTQAPEWMPEAYKAHYGHFQEFLQQYGVVTALDVVALQVLATTYGEWRLLEQALAQQDFIQADPNLVKRRDRARRSTLDLLKEFGMTPVSRAKIDSNLTSNPSTATLTATPTPMGAMAFLQAEAERALDG